MRYLKFKYILKKINSCPSSSEEERLAVSKMAGTSRSLIDKLSAFHRSKVRNVDGDPVSGAILNLSAIKFSRNDLRRKIVLPKFISEDLAENVGVLIGDGSIYISNHDYNIVYSGNLVEDRYYFENYLVPLNKRLFNILFKNIIYHNEFRLYIRSKALLTFYSKAIGLPLGLKSNITIPRKILRSKSLITHCIRGIMDTDFSLSFKSRKKYHSYPVISAYFKSKALVKQLENLLKKLNFKVVLNYDYERIDKRIKNGKFISQAIYLNGKQNLELWWNLIESRNPRLVTRYLIWKKFGFCPPYTNMQQRINILKGKINPKEFYK